MRVPRLGFLVPVLVTLSPTASGPALAVPITFGISGTVNFAGASLGPDPDIDVGDPIDIFFTFESTTPDSFGGPDFGSYQGLISSFTMSAGNETLLATSPTNTNEIYIETASFQGDGKYEMWVVGDLFNGDEVLLNGQPIDWVDFFLRFNGGTTTPTSDALPLVPPSPDDYATIEQFFAIIDFPEGGGEPLFAWDIYYDLESFYLVPEASTGTLLGLSLAVWGVLRRWTRRC